MNIRSLILVKRCGCRFQCIREPLLWGDDYIDVAAASAFWQKC